MNTRRNYLWYAAGALTPTIVLSIVFFAWIAPHAPNGSNSRMLVESAISVLFFAPLSFAVCALLFSAGTAFFKRTMQSKAAYGAGAILGLLGIVFVWFTWSLLRPHLITIAVEMLLLPLGAGFLAPLLGRRSATPTS